MVAGARVSGSTVDLIEGVLPRFGMTRLRAQPLAFALALALFTAAGVAAVWKTRIPVAFSRLSCGRTRIRLRATLLPLSPLAHAQAMRTTTRIRVVGLRRTSGSGAAVTSRQFLGSPSPRVAMMLRWISEVPPAMVCGTENT